MNENGRQAIHAAACLCAMAIVALFGTQAAAYLIGAVLLCGLALAHLKLRGKGIGPLEEALEWFERPGATSGYGAMTLTAGCLAIITLIARPEQALASLWMLGLGDSASTLVGRRGSHPLPYNGEKTVEGSLAFFIACLPSALLSGAPALAVAAAASVAESLHSHIDDNLLIAIVCVVGFKLLGA